MCVEGACESRPRRIRPAVPTTYTTIDDHHPSHSAHILGITTHFTSYTFCVVVVVLKQTVVRMTGNVCGDEAPPFVPTLEEEHEEVVPISPTSRRLSGEFDREDGDDLPHRVVADDGDESSRLVVAGPRTCIFCGSGARRPRRSSSFDWSTITRQDGMCFHPCCALWCPEVFYDEQHGVLRSLLYARMRCAPIKCAYCRKYGASVGCVEIDCQLSYHLPCALKAHASLGLEEFVLRCPRHTQP